MTTLAILPLAITLPPTRSGIPPFVIVDPTDVIEKPPTLTPGSAAPDIVSESSSSAFVPCSFRLKTISPAKDAFTWNLAPLPAEMPTISDSLTSLIEAPVASIRRSFKVPARPRASVLSELVGGGREFWEHHTARFVFIRLALFQAIFIGFVGLIAIRAHQLGGDTSLNGWMSTFQGLGAVIGATTVSIWVGRFGRVRTYLTSVCIGTAALIAYGYTNVIPAAIVTLAVLGACTSTVFVTLNGALQRDMPNHQRGRFNAIIQASNGSLFTVAALSQGRLADHIGLARVFALAALIHFTLVMGPYLLHPLRFRVLDHPVVPIEGLALHLPSRP